MSLHCANGIDSNLCIELTAKQTRKNPVEIYVCPTSAYHDKLVREQCHLADFTILGNTCL